MDCGKDILFQVYSGVFQCVTGILSMKNFGFGPLKDKTTKISLLQRRNKLVKKLCYCFLLNGLVFGFSAFAFESMLLPFIQWIADFIGGKDVADGVWQFLQPVLLSLFNTLWLAPIFLISRVINFLWFQDVADLALELRLSRESNKSSSKPKVKLSFTTFVADTICSVGIETLFLIQSSVVTLFPIPYVGNMLNFFHMCLLYSLYAFEYKWINFGWPLHKRLAFIDYNWPYFIGFGLPLAVMTMLCDSCLINLCVFSVFFPLYIISGMNSKPVLSNFHRSFHIFVPVLYCWKLCTRLFTLFSVFCICIWKVVAVPNTATKVANICN